MVRYSEFDEHAAMQQRRRSLSSPRMDLTDLHPALPMFRAVVRRNSDRARRRHLRARGTVMDTGAVMAEDGSLMPEPSDTGHIQAEQDLPPSLPRPSETTVVASIYARPYRWMMAFPMLQLRNVEGILRRPPRAEKRAHLGIWRSTQRTLIAKTSDYYLGAASTSVWM